MNTDNADGTTTTRVDANEANVWVYIDLETASEVVPINPGSNAEWDLAFQRFKIKSNGGVSGSGGVEVAVLPDADFDGMSEAPASGYVTDRADSDDEDEDPDTAFLTGDGWYTYNPVDHTLSPRDIVYIVRTVEGGYFKLQMLDYYDDAGTSGFPTFRWGPVDPPPPPGDLVVDASTAGEWVYVDVSTSQIVPVADQGASDAWDVAFSRTQVATNGGTSGSGLGGARLAPDELDWDDILTSPTVGFAVDEMLPVPGPPGSGQFSGNPVLNNWYDYDVSTHAVSPKDVVFLVRTAAGDYAKLWILAWDDGVFTIRAQPIMREITVTTSFLDASDGEPWIFMNFRLGDFATVVDPETSLGWDLAVLRTKLQTNSGTSGSGPHRRRRVREAQDHGLRRWRADNGLGPRRSGAE